MEQCDLTFETFLVHMPAITSKNLYFLLTISQHHMRTRISKGPMLSVWSYAQEETRSKDLSNEPKTIA